MPETTGDARPVCALCYPTKGLQLKAWAAGEPQKLLGGAEIGYSASQRGQFLRRRLPGHAHLGERFFDWTALDSSEFGALVGRLKPDAAIAEVVGEHACRVEILRAVVEFRKAVGA